MTDREFSKIAPASNFTLESFLIMLKNSTSIGVRYQCTKMAISLNKIIPIVGGYTLATNQVGLVLSSQSATSGNSIWTDVNGVNNFITFQGNLNDLTFQGAFTMTGFSNVAIFDLY